MDIILDKDSPLDVPKNLRREDTQRFGPFKLQVGIDNSLISISYQRVVDAQRRFKSSPLSQVANQLEPEVVVSSVFGTNSIEGGKLTERETEEVLHLDPRRVQEEEQLRAVNIKRAYDLAKGQARQPSPSLNLSYVQEIHAAITGGLKHERNQPGRLRDNPKNVVTRVGNKEHGGVYKPPQFGEDVKSLLKALIEWQNELETKHVPALIRAPLMHYYFELIHPFWDGNGRVGRVLEATILLADGFEYAPFVQARYYLENIHEYFTLFNHCRKLSDKDHEHPNSPFVQFFLNGMLQSIDHLHDRVNLLVKELLFESRLNKALTDKGINNRQHAIVAHVLRAQEPISMKQMKEEPWYKALYAKLTEKTESRDLSGLKRQGLIIIEADKTVSPGFDS